MSKWVAKQLVVLMLLLFTAAAQADLYVIVHASNPVEAMTAEQIERLFLLKAKRFDNGDAAEPVSQSETSKTRENFNARVLQRNEQQLKYYWSRKMFSGGDKPPPVVGGDTEVENFVASHKGGIGYLGTAPKNAGVKIVLRLGK